MRYCKLLLMCGIVLGLSGPAWAIAVTMNMRNFDDGTLYGVADNTYTGEVNLNGLNQIPPTGGIFGGVQSDTWGVFRVENMQDVNGNYFYQGGPTQEITAIFWGERDTYLKQTTSGGVVTQEIHGIGLHAAFFYDTTPDWSTAVLAGPAGWTIDGSGRPAYAGITDGTLIWTMNSTSGWSQSFPTEEFFATFNSAAASYNSHGNLHLDMGPVPGWGTGINNWTLDTNTIPAWNVTGTALDKMTDLLLTFDGTDVGSGSWLLRTSDPMEGDLIPEPVTMAGLLLGVGCLGRYIRKRR
ncbi:MAG TPA: PEP-CTERM sorting domain-containing protein [Phycisphaerae bacterium]|nr:PEP-CTERM sorting domain-containing protein [Phycisphaerae bacterium]